MIDSITINETLQRAIVRWTVESSRFFKQVGSIVDPSWLKLKPAAACMKVAKEQYLRHTVLLDQAMRTEHDEGRISQEDLKEIEAFIGTLHASDIPRDDDTWRAISRGVKQQLKHTLVEKLITQHGKRKNLSQLASEILAVERIADLTVHENYDFSSDTDMDVLKSHFKTINEAHRTMTGTPVDELTQGHFPGQLVIFMGMTGVGKSMMLTQVAAYLLSLGWNVVFITLELAAPMQAQRIIAPVINNDLNSVLAGGEDSIDTFRLSVPGRFYLMERPAGVTVDSLREDVRTQCPFQPDVILVDYLDRLGGGVSMVAGENNSYAAGGRATEALRSWAKELDITLFTAVQPQRQDKSRRRKGSEPLDTESGADSQNKARITDDMITLNLVEFEDSTYGIYAFVAKNRFGPGAGRRTPTYAVDRSFGLVLPNEVLRPGSTRVLSDAEPHKKVELLNTDKPFGWLDEE